MPNPTPLPRKLTMDGVPGVYRYADLLAYATHKGLGEVWSKWYYGQTGLLGTDGVSYVYDDDWDRFVARYRIIGDADAHA